MCDVCTKEQWPFLPFLVGPVMSTRTTLLADIESDGNMLSFLSSKLSASLDVPSVVSFWRNVIRRHKWLLPHLSIGKIHNLATAALDFACRNDRVSCHPVVLKIDLSPLCNLHCPACVHAVSQWDSPAELRNQRFRFDQLMQVEQFKALVSEVRGTAMALSLYYLGDPLLHPKLAELCKIASDADMNTHISSNFSMRLSDQQLRKLVCSGLTHVTICVDGFTQQSYQRTRRGGRLALVLENLERIIQVREKQSQRWPIVEVQYLTYPHNEEELPAARDYFAQIGVDDVTSMPGVLDNRAIAQSRHRICGPRKRTALFPCPLPYFMMVIKYDGNVVPCCSHRAGAQYSNGDMRTLGNVFRDGVNAVWTSSAYTWNRRIVASPEWALIDLRAREQFCYACPSLFEFEDCSSGGAEHS